MKTYKRKRPEYQLIENVGQLCRLCLVKDNETVPIFSGESDIIYDTLVLRIMTCVGIEVTKEENMPNIICVECIKELEHVYAFRKKCEAANRKLKSHVMAIADREANRAVLSLQESEIQLVDNVEKLDTLIVLNEEVVTETRTVDMPDPAAGLMNHDAIYPVTAIDQPQANTESNWDISSELRQKLIESNILLSHEDNTLSFVKNNIDITKVLVELYTSDACVVNLELIEEDEISAEDLPSDTESKTKANIRQMDPELSTYLKCKEVNKYNDKRVQCKHCNKWLTNATVLQRHLRIHSGERPFVCQKCNRAFSQKEILQRHELVHLELKPHGCPRAACGRSFTQRGALLSHLRAHSSRALALHACRRCRKRFLHRSGHPLLPDILFSFFIYTTFTVYHGTCAWSTGVRQHSEYIEEAWWWGDSYSSL